jgi:hypothetical protein
MRDWSKMAGSIPESVYILTLRTIKSTEEESDAHRSF